MVYRIILPLLAVAGFSAFAQQSHYNTNILHDDDISSTEVPVGVIRAPERDSDAADPAQPAAAAKKKAKKKTGLWPASDDSNNNNNYGSDSSNYGSSPNLGSSPNPGTPSNYGSNSGYGSNNNSNLNSGNSGSNYGSGSNSGFGPASTYGSGGTGGTGDGTSYDPSQSPDIPAMRTPAQLSGGSYSNNPYLSAPGQQAETAQQSAAEAQAIMQGGGAQTGAAMQHVTSGQGAPAGYVPMGH